MKSIDKLRQRIKLYNADPVLTYLNEVADEIESEIAERYMLLPVDADGVPIRLGDKISYESDDCKQMTGTVVNMQYCNRGGLIGNGWLINSGQWVDPWICEHVKPRTIEDVLEEFIADFDKWDEDCTEHRAARREKLFAKYVEELEKIMEVGA